MTTSRQIQLVTLDNFFKNIHDPVAQRYFMGMLTARAEGYGPDYDKSVLPFDQTDFMARHHLFCSPDSGQFVPIGGFKHLILRRCDEYGLRLPILNMVGFLKSPSHIDAVDRIIEDHRSAGKELMYGGSFALKKSWRGDKGFSKQIHELMAALTYRDFTELGISTLIGVAALRFKTDRLFEAMGYHPMTHNGRTLEQIVARFGLNGEPSILIRLDEPSTWARECYVKHLHLLSSGITVTAETLKAA